MKKLLILLLIVAASLQAAKSASSRTNTGSSRMMGKGPAVRQYTLSQKYQRATQVSGHPNCKVFPSTTELCRDVFTPTYKSEKIDGKKRHYTYGACGGLYFCDTKAELQKIFSPRKDNTHQTLRGPQGGVVRHGYVSGVTSSGTQGHTETYIPITPRQNQKAAQPDLDFGGIVPGF